MRKKKTYLIIIIILIIYLAGMYFFLGKDNLKEEKEATTIIVGDSTVWRYSSRKWLNIKKRATKETLNWQQFTIYDDNKKLGNYYLWLDDKWYFFDKNKNAIQTNGKTLAYKSNFNIDIKEYTEEQITDYSYVNYVLNENNLSTSSKFTSNYKVSIDIDNDQVNEDFYVISNSFAMDFTPDRIFSIVFMVKNNKIYYLYNDISDNKVNNGCKPYLNYFLDLNSDKKYEVILSCGKFSTETPVDMLYQFNNDSFEILISNQ